MIFSQRIGIRCAAIIIVLIITQSRADDVTDKQISYRYLSELQSEYFTKIPKWWLSISEIDGGHASNEYLRQLVDEHREYMFKPSREQLKLTYYRTYLLLNIEHYNDNITVIYNTLKENYNYLFDEKAAESNLFDVNQLTTWAQSEKIESMKHHLQSLFDITFQPNAIYKHIQKEAKCCERYVQYVVSENQLVREYYGNVAVFLLRGYAMVQLSYILLTAAGHGNLQQESLSYQDNFQQQYTNFREFIEDMLRGASRDLWKCDPNPYLNKNDYYTAVTNFMQGYVDNEINLNSGQSCSSTCEDYVDTKNYGCQKDTLCAHNNFQSKACKGRVLNCSTINEDLTACAVNEGSERRRYNWLKLKNGTTLGHDLMCLNAEKRDVASWTDWFYKCNTCLCYCDEPGTNSDRYFSLRAIESDIQANKVITGVALQKRNQVIQFVIMERELLPEIEVDAVRYGPKAWKVTDFDYLNSADSHEGVDYHALTWVNRSINLDTLTLPTNQVLTGVRFILIDGHLALQIRGTDVDYDTGKLINLEKNEWVNNGDKERTKITIEGGDIPSKSPNLATPIDSTGKYVEFQPSDMQKDVAQVTVPYIESVLLEASDPRPLSGLGLYYKRDPEYSGFIAVKLIAYDLQPTVLPPHANAEHHATKNEEPNALPTNLNISDGDEKSVKKNEQKQ